MRNVQKNGQSISWKHNEALYLTETNTVTPGIRLCHKLTRYHVWLSPYAKMKVNLAAQVSAMILPALHLRLTQVVIFTGSE